MIFWSKDSEFKAIRSRNFDEKKREMEGEYSKGLRFPFRKGESGVFSCRRAQKVKVVDIERGKLMKKNHRENRMGWNNFTL